MSYVKGHYKTVNGKKVYVNGYYNSNSKHSNDSGEEIHIGGLEPMIKKNQVIGTPQRQYDSDVTLNEKWDEFNEDIRDEFEVKSVSYSGGGWTELKDLTLETSAVYDIEDKDIDVVKSQLKHLADKYNQTAISLVQFDVNGKDEYIEFDIKGLEFEEVVERLEDTELPGFTITKEKLIIFSFDDIDNEEALKRLQKDFGTPTVTKANISFVEKSKTDEEQIQQDEIDKKNYHQRGLLKENSPPINIFQTVKSWINKGFEAFRE